MGRDSASATQLPPIADLPEKLEMTVYCTLTREQATLYRAVVDEMLERIQSSEGIERRGLVLATMLRLKQVCNHPAQMLADGSTLPGRSGKLQRVEEILEEVLAEGDRALVFTQFAAWASDRAILAPWHLNRLSSQLMTMHNPTRAAQAPAVTEALADHLERIAVGAVGLTTRALARADAGFELTFPQWRALLVLGEDADGARVGEVATRVGVTVPATSRLLRRLERRGLATLSVDEQDRRATRARLTDRGRTVRAAILGHRRAALQEVVAALDHPERLDLREGLRAIAAELGRFA